MTTSADEGEMTLTAPPLFARQFLFGKPFLKWCSAQRINLDISDTKLDLFSQRPLAAIRLAATEHPDLSSTPLLKVSAIIAAAPSIAKNAHPSSEEWWADQVLINTNVSNAGWLRAWNALGLTLPKLPHTHLFSSYAAALEAAASGHGIILAPLPFANVELRAGRLMKISNMEISSNQIYSLLMRHGPALSPRGRALQQRVIAVTAGRNHSTTRTGFSAGPSEPEREKGGLSEPERGKGDMDLSGSLN